MRAWLLLLAVLATFHISVQVASTEDITSRFITAILPVVEPRNRSVLVIEKSATTTTTSSSSASTSSALMQRPAKSTTTTNALATSRASTALARAFSSSGEISEYQAYPPTTSVSTSLPTSESTSKSRSPLTDANSESDKIMSNNIGTDNAIIEIKNYKEFESKYTSSSDSVPTEQVTKPHRTNQSEVDKNNQNQTSIKHLKISHKKPNEQLENQPQTNSAVQVQKTSEINVQQEQQNTKAFSFTKATTTNSNTPTSSASSISSASTAIDSASSTAISTSANDEVSNSGLDSKSTSNDRIDTNIEIQEIHEDEGEPATYSNKEIIGQKMEPDPSTLVEIENSLLSLFNMKRPPKIDRSKIVIPEAMRQLYNEIMGNDVDSVNIPKPGLLTKSANTVRSFTHQDSKIDDRFPHHHRFRLHFDISSIPAEEKLKAAELQLTRDAVSHTLLNARQTNRTRYQVMVYDITRVGVRGKREPNYLLLDTKTVRLNSTETVSLDVQPAVDRWLDTPKKNYGLLVEVRTMRSLKPAPHHHVRLRRSADEPHSNWQHKQPLLFTYTDDGRHKSRSIRDVSARSKRAGNKRSHRRKNTEENCRRHSLYVDFTDVGWSDWIVAPPGYDAYYCHGKCPFPLAEHLNSTNHAVVQTLVNNINPGKVPKACCVPTQLEGISMLYLNDQRTVVLKNYQDMTVVGCGCR